MSNVIDPCWLHWIGVNDEEQCDKCGKDLLPNEWVLYYSKTQHMYCLECGRKAGGEKIQG